MSNAQWHEDQAVGERALRVHARLVQRAPEAVALLRRLVKYAREDRAETPGVTRLARALDEARTLLEELDGDA